MGEAILSQGEYSSIFFEWARNDNLQKLAFQNARRIITRILSNVLPAPGNKYQSARLTLVRLFAGQLLLYRRPSVGKVFCRTTASSFPQIDIIPTDERRAAHETSRPSAPAHLAHRLLRRGAHPARPDHCRDPYPRANRDPVPTPTKVDVRVNIPAEVEQMVGGEAYQGLLESIGENGEIRVTDYESGRPLDLVIAPETVRVSETADWRFKQVVTAEAKAKYGEEVIQAVWNPATGQWVRVTEVNPEIVAPQKSSNRQDNDAVVEMQKPGEVFAALPEDMQSQLKDWLKTVDKKHTLPIRFVIKFPDGRIPPELAWWLSHHIAEAGFWEGSVPPKKINFCC